MSKLSFRARALDASKPLPIYRSNEIPDSADCSVINRAVPQMPTGMEKEEESEHHLQRAICAGSLIPTPEVFSVEDVAYYEKLYPEIYKMPRQLIYMQPFTMEADIPDYDMDSEDEIWVNSQAGKLELTPEKFEEMMDRLEKGSGQTVVTLQEAKALIKEDDDLIIAVYDYWLNKRLKTQHPLIPQVRTEARFGVSNHNPYIAFRRRTEKMQTRKNRKNDESSYEKMLKLKRDLTRAVTLLEMVKRREKSKREFLHLTIEVFEKRFQAGDFSGQIVSDALSARPARPAFTPLYQPNSLSPWGKDDHLVSALTRKEKRHYKKRRHKSSTKAQASSSVLSAGSALGYAASQGLGSTGADIEFLSSEEDINLQGTQSDEEEEDEGPFAFRRKKDCSYQAPVEGGCWPWEGGPQADKRYRFCQTSVSNPGGNGYRRVGFGRRRVGRGGRIILDRMSYRDEDDFWRSMGYSVMDSSYSNANKVNSSAPLGAFPVQSQSIEPNGLYPKLSSLLPKTSLNSPHSPNAYSEEKEFLHFRPKTPERRPEDTLLSSEVVVPSDDDLEIEDCFQSAEAPIIESIAPPTPSLGPYLGAVVSQGEAPLFFDTRDLLEDPIVYDTGACPESSHRLSNDNLVLLDEQSSELSHAYYLYSCENSSGNSSHGGGGGSSWIESDYTNPWLSNQPFPADDFMDTSDSSSQQPQPPAPSDSKPDNPKPKPSDTPDMKKKDKDGGSRNKVSQSSHENGDDGGNSSNSMNPPQTSSSSSSSTTFSSNSSATFPTSKEAPSSRSMNHDGGSTTSTTATDDVEMGSEDEVIETVVGSGGLNFIVGSVSNNSSSESSDKRRGSVDKDDKENNDRRVRGGGVVGGGGGVGSSNGGGGGGGGGGRAVVENGTDVLVGGVVVATSGVVTSNNNSNDLLTSSTSSEASCVVINEDSSSAPRTPNNNNIINVNSSRSNSTFQLVVDSSGLGTVVGEGLVETSSSLVAKSVVVGSDSNSNSSASSAKARTNGLQQLVNMKNYGGSPEKLCHIVT